MFVSNFATNASEKEKLAFGDVPPRKVVWYALLVGKSAAPAPPVISNALDCRWQGHTRSRHRSCRSRLNKREIEPPPDSY